MPFSNDFLWGAASAAVQVEGAAYDDGKVAGIWDALSKGHIKHGENALTACDHYHRFQKDIAIMKQLGLKSYRFSVSWCRIISDIDGTVNEKGISFYKELVTELTANGIEPMCTLYHWDLPMWAYEAGGWKNEKIADWFAYYAEVVVKALSDKVKYWFTINEPQCFIGFGYFLGTHAPFETNKEEDMPNICRNVMLAHGRAVEVIRKFASTTPIVGFAPVSNCYVPDSNSEEDIQKAKNITFRTDRKFIGITYWSDSIILGKFPDEIKAIISEDDKKIICQPLDFYAYNVYSSSNYDEGKDGVSKTRYSGLPITALGWAITPQVMYWSPKFLYERYGLPILISENGMANFDFVMTDGAVHDPQRIEYIKSYLTELKRVVDEGVPIIGYQYWSIMDNFEWTEGYDARFGLVYVDYKTQERIIKDSALYYSEIIKTNGNIL